MAGGFESVHYAAALCSIKMESPGPFSESIENVKARMVNANPSNEYVEIKDQSPLRSQVKIYKNFKI